MGIRKPVRRLEQGTPGVAIGLVFEAAILCGVELFSSPADQLPQRAAEAKARAALLPARIRTRPTVIDDDF